MESSSLPLPEFHLRRVFYDSARANGPPEFILLGVTTKFGRNADNVDVVLTSAVYSNMISRNHACITGRIENGRITGYSIKDTSLNGTYINDRRVKESEELKANDIIKFGHMNGAAIKPGSSAPQANAEFSFMFERANLNQQYIGWTGMERKRTVIISGSSGTGMREAPLTRRETTTTIPSTLASSSFPQPTVASSNDPLIRQMLFYQQMLNTSQANFPLLQYPQQNILHNFPPNLMQMNGVSSSISPCPSSIPSTPIPPAPIPSLPSRDESKPSSTSGPSTHNTSTVECDSSVPSPPKSTTTVVSASTTHRDEDRDEEYMRVPDSPPRAPRPPSLAGRSFTNSPVPSPPIVPEQLQHMKQQQQQAAASSDKKPAAPKKPAGHPGKAPRAAAGDKRPNEVARLLNDLTEGSFTSLARRNSTGAGSERRRLQDEGKKVKRKEAKQNKLLRQLSDVSSEASDSDEEEVVKPKKAKKAKESKSSKKTEKKDKKKKKKKKKGSESEESDDYEETDEEEERVVEKKKEKEKGSKGSTKATKANAVKEVEDEEDYASFEDTVDTTCSSKVCKKPTLSSVNWVQCEDCEGWFHNMCVFGSDSMVLPKNKDFYCGCKRKKTTIR